MNFIELKNFTIDKTSLISLNKRHALSFAEKWNHIFFSVLSDRAKTQLIEEINDVLGFLNRINFLHPNEGKKYRYDLNELNLMKEVYTDVFISFRSKLIKEDFLEDKIWLYFLMLLRHSLSIEKDIWYMVPNFKFDKKDLNISSKLLSLLEKESKKTYFTKAIFDIIEGFEELYEIYEISQSKCIKILDAIDNECDLINKDFNHLLKLLKNASKNKNEVLIIMNNVT